MNGISVIQVVLDVGIGVVIGIALLSCIGHLAGVWKWRGKGFPRSR